MLLNAFKAKRKFIGQQGNVYQFKSHDKNVTIKNWTVSISISNFIPVFSQQTFLEKVPIIATQVYQMALSMVIAKHF